MAVDRRSIVRVPTPGSVPHVGVVLDVSVRDGIQIARVARGTGSSHRDRPCEVVELDEDDPYCDAARMSLSKTTYFYADEILWCPLSELSLWNKRECPIELWLALRELDGEWQAALVQADEDELAKPGRIAELLKKIGWDKPREYSLAEFERHQQALVDRANELVAELPQPPGGESGSDDDG